MIDGTSATGTTSTGDRVAVILTRDPDESATTTLTTTTVPAAGTVINGSSTSTSVTTAPAVINGSSTTTSLTTTTAPAVINGSSTTNGTTTSSTTNGTAPAAGGAKRTLFDVLGTPGALMTRPEKDRLLKAKAKKNTTKAVPVAVVEEMLDFACAVYPRLQSGTKFDALPKKVLLPPRVTKTTVLAGVMPNPRQYETAGMTLIIVDWSALGIDLHCPICGTTLRNYLPRKIPSSGTTPLELRPSSRAASGPVTRRRHCRNAHVVKRKVATRRYFVTTMRPFFDPSTLMTRPYIHATRTSAATDDSEHPAILCLSWSNP